MEQMIIKFLGSHADAIISTISGAILLAVGYAFKKAMEHWKIKIVQRYLELIEHWVETVVMSISQQYADELKKAAADGKLTEEEKKRLKTMAVDIIMNSLSGRMQKAISFLVGDIKAYISHRIEAFLLKWRERK